MGGGSVPMRVCHASGLGGWGNVLQAWFNDFKERKREEKAPDTRVEKCLEAKVTPEFVSGAEFCDRNFHDSLIA